MHQIPEYQTAVTLFSRDGNVWVYRTLKAALKALGVKWIAANVGAHFREFDHVARHFDQARNVWVREPMYVEREFIMRDDAGGVVTAATFHGLIEHRRRARWMRWSRMLETWNGEGPVPGIGRSRGGHWYRRPQTMMERRQAALVLKEEGEVAPRGARSLGHLANAWDDYYITARSDRNWKRNRRTQWKAPRD